MSVSQILESLSNQMANDNLNEEVADQLAYSILFENPYLTDSEEILVLRYYDWALEKKGWALERKVWE